MYAARRAHEAAGGDVPMGRALLDACSTLPDEMARACNELVQKHGEAGGAAMAGQRFRVTCRARGNGSRPVRMRAFVYTGL